MNSFTLWIWSFSHTYTEFPHLHIFREIAYLPSLLVITLLTGVKGHNIVGFNIILSNDH